MIKNQYIYIKFIILLLVLISFTNFSFAAKNFDQGQRKQKFSVYIIVVKFNPQLQGYMVRGRAVGFIKTGSSVNDVAHELAHGAFGLEHTFPAIPINSSNNLMDYANQTHLVKSQWEQIQNPRSILTWFDSEEDGSIILQGIHCLINENESSDMTIELSDAFIAIAEEIVVNRYKLNANRKNIWPEMSVDIINALNDNNSDLKKLFPSTMKVGEFQDLFCPFLSLVEMIWQDNFIVQFLHSSNGWQQERNQIISAIGVANKAQKIIERHDKARSEWLAWELIGDNLTTWFVGMVAYSDGVQPSGFTKTRIVRFKNSNYNQVVNLSSELTLFSHGGEDAVILANARNLPGTALGNGIQITGKWLRGTEGNAGLFPKQIADKLKNQTFANFNKFREAFWKEVAKDAELSVQFSKVNITRMQKGLAPYVKNSQQLGGQLSYILHHKTPINQGGAVYNFDNLYIVTPKFHKEILNPAYHYGYGY